MSKFIREIYPTRDAEIIPYIAVNARGDYVVSVDEEGSPMRVFTRDFYEEVELPESLRKYEVSTKENDAASDNVQHPSHYTHGKYETIDVIEDVTSGYDDGFMAHCVGTAVKYLYRAPHKHATPLDDLRKARQYVEFAIKRAKELE